MVQFFKDTFKELSIYKSLTNAVDKKISPLLVSGFSMIHLAQMITAFSDRNEPVLVVAGSDSEAKRLCGDINAMAGSQICKVFPSKEWVLTAVDGASFEYVHERISALSDFHNGIYFDYPGIFIGAQPSVASFRVIFAALRHIFRKPVPLYYI